MRYVVGILYAPTSNDADVKSVVRASNTDDAIISLMKASDLGYVYAVYAYPLKKRLEGPSPSDWRWNVRCSVSGKVFMSVSM